jgi:FkbM family methyltransferase
VTDLGHIFSGAPTYFRRFGFVNGLLVGIQTVAPRLAGHNQLTAIRVPGMRAPLYLRARTSDLRAFQQVFVDGDHDVAPVRAPRTIIDAGANVGFASVAFANRYPDAQVIALEVDAENYEILRRNVAPYPNVHPLRAGLWSHRAYLKITNPTGDAWAFQVTETDQSDADRIEALSVADVCATCNVDRIDLLKVDIEGAEYEVFSRNVEPWINRVALLMIELHDHLNPGCSAAVDRATEGRFTEGEQFGEYHVFTRVD